jgi:hypothetical protein
MLTSEEKLLISQLKVLDSKAKQGPWYPQGASSKGKAVYRIGPAEEALIIALRNNAAKLIALAEKV